jgi:hypothetical protein
MLPIPHLSPTTFYSSPNEARSIYNLLWLSYHQYIFVLMLKCQLSLNKLINDALKHEVILVFEERYKDIGCQVSKVLSRTISGRGQLRKSPRRSSQWDLFPVPDCVTSIRWAQLRITFSLRKKEWLQKARNVLYNVWLPIIWTRPESEHCLCSQARARAHL